MKNCNAKELHYIQTKELQKELTTVSTTDGSPVPSKHAWESEGIGVCDKGTRARPGQRVTAEVCVLLLLSVSKQTKPLSGSALDYKQQVPFLDKAKNVTCSNHFLKHSELAQNQVFSNDFAELVSVLTQSPASTVFHLNSIKLCEFMCILMFWLLHALIWLHSSWGLWAITTMAAAWQRPDKARHAQGLLLQTLQLILLLQSYHAQWLTTPPHCQGGCYGLWSVLHIRPRRKKSTAGLVLPTLYLQCEGAFSWSRKNPQELFQSKDWLLILQVSCAKRRWDKWTEKKIKIQNSSPPASATHAEKPIRLFVSGDSPDLPVAFESLPVARRIIFSSELSI